MIVGNFHQGSGLGNQLFRYVMTRTIAADKGYKWGMRYVPGDSAKPAGFKGASFMKIDWGKDASQVHSYPDVPGSFQEWHEKKVVADGIDIRGYDPEVNFVQDNTIIEGEFQDERYWGHRLEKFDEWMPTEYLPIPDDTCVIGFRGGEYSVFPDLFLPREYWDKAISMFPGFHFEVHTDDPVTARQFFPKYPIIHDIGLNWRAMRYARHAIIANSSFYILPRLMQQYESELTDNDASTVAPRYWARHTKKVWALPQNYYPEFTWL